jgi:uncharacterized oxidoreductase
MRKRLTSTQWRQVAQRILKAIGTPDDIAWQVSRSLVESDLAGVKSHGVALIPHYYDYWKAGWLNPTGRAEIANETPSTAVIDGYWGFGVPAAQTAATLAVEKARAAGIAAVSIIRSGHVGRLGQFVEAAAEEEMLAMAFANAGPSGGMVAPYGGSEPVFSTNPIAASAPAREHPPFVMDFATSQAATGKIFRALEMGQEIPGSWALNAQGQPVTSAHELLNGGIQLPFGEHKGYALTLFVELLCGALTGAGCSTRPERIAARQGGNACFIIVIDIVHFIDLETYYAAADDLLSRVERVTPAPGFERVMIPGELEARHRSSSVTEGIVVEDNVWEKLLSIAAEQHLTFEDIEGV